MADSPPAADRSLDAARLVMARCDELARCSEEPGRLTRTFLREPFHDAHRLVGQWMSEAGLEVRTDAAGNLVGRRPASSDGAPVFLVGSHLDTVPDAGRYDGILGVLAGIALAASLDAAGAALPFHLDVIAFSEEEGARFRTPFLGSLAAVGEFPPELLEVTDRQEVSVGEAIRNFGLDPGQIPSAAYSKGSVLGFLEIHIEQGAMLESVGAPVGVVTGIAGQTRLECRLLGETRHAGTTSMSARRDALAAAARLVLMTEALGQATPDLVATVGSLDVQPNASNCVPGQVTLTVDIRSPDDATRLSAVEQWLTQAHDLLNPAFQTGAAPNEDPPPRSESSLQAEGVKEREERHSPRALMSSKSSGSSMSNNPFSLKAGLRTEGAVDRGFGFEVLSRREQLSVPCDRALTEMLAAAASARLGTALPQLASGAGHDAMILARLAPIAMLFVRCRGGISHHPDESVALEDVAAALSVGEEFLLRLAREPLSSFPSHFFSSTQSPLQGSPTRP